MRREEGEYFAKEHGMLFVETSAKDRINVDQAFQNVVEKTTEKVASGTINVHNEVIRGLKVELRGEVGE